MQYLEQKVGTAIPAMRHDLDSRLKSKADNRDLAEALKEKASAEAFKVVVERLNKLEEKVRHGGVDGSSSEGNSNSDDDRDSAEGSGASDGDGEARRKERKKRKEKILKGSASTDNVQKKGSKMGLGDIVEEEEEKDSVKSNSDNKKDKKKGDLLVSKLTEDQNSAGGNSKASRRTNRGAVSATGGGAGGPVNAEFQAETEQKFEDIARTIEDIKFEQNRLQQEIDKTANNLTMN